MISVPSRLMVNLILLGFMAAPRSWFGEPRRKQEVQIFFPDVAKFERNRKNYFKYNTEGNLTGPLKKPGPPD